MAQESAHVGIWEAVTALDDLRHDATILVDGDLLTNPDVAKRIEADLDRNRLVAAIVSHGSADLPKSMANRLAVIERPLRVRHLRAVLATPATTKPAVPEPPPGRLIGLNMLAAEDNEVNRLVLEDMLSLEGAKAVLFGNGLLALEHLKEIGAEAFDILITDVQMPEMNGYELASAVVSLYPALPVIGLTAHALEAEHARCREAGMVETVIKPVDADDLVEGKRQELPTCSGRSA